MATATKGNNRKRQTKDARMPKRKREDDIEEVISKARGELHHALKLAKGFERQRQSKRLHDKKTEADKKARIEKEVVVLKVCDQSAPFFDFRN